MYPLKLHKTLTPEKWHKFGDARQILMIACEINRALSINSAKQAWQLQATGGLCLAVALAKAGRLSYNTCDESHRYDRGSQ